jgi:hypothetical protein
VTQRIGTNVDIAWLVTDLVGRVAHVQHAVVLSHDGFDRCPATSPAG